MKIKKILRGLISYIPILKVILKKKGTGGSNSSKYCLDTFINHAELLVKSGMKFPPENIGEIGPGDTLGIGFAALLFGSKKYVALDSVAHASKEINLTIFNQLVDLIESEPYKSKINLLISRDTLDSTMSASNLVKIKNSIESISDFSDPISYSVPWWKKGNVSQNSLDLILSNAVMEHVIELKSTYESMFKWLKPGGYCSHVIDYRAHEFSDTWYKHWEFSELIWKILMHGRIYPINRMPHSYHRKIILETGFEIIHETKETEINKADIEKINPTIKKYFDENDLNISTGTFIIRKPLE